MSANDKAKDHETPRRRPVPEEYQDLDDAELGEAVRERLRAHEDPDFAGIAVRCHDGVVRLSDDIPSDLQRQVIRQIVADGMGLEVIDRLHVAPLDRERETHARSGHDDVPAEERIAAGRGMRPLALEPFRVLEDEEQPEETVPDAPVAEEE
jgi:hypothetical protein